MTPLYLAEITAEQRGAELRREAHTARLARIARCCRPSAWGRGFRRAVEAAARLGRRDRPAASCCAIA